MRHDLSRLEHPPSGLRLVGGSSWLERAVVAAPTAIFVYRDRFVYANRACEQLTGYSLTELRQMELTDLLHPSFRVAVRERLEARLDSGPRSSRFELKIVRKNGRQRWVDFSSLPIPDAGDVAFVGSAYDITERKLAEMSLAESEERLNLAQRAARSLAWEWHTDDDRLSISTHADEIMGFAISQAVQTGAQFLNYVHPDDRERFRRALRRALKGGGDLKIELRCLTPTGRTLWLAQRALTVTRPNGWTERMIGVAHDVTERKIAEEALFQEKERAQVTLASIADGVIRTDAAGLVDYLNPVAQRLTGWSLAEAYGRPVGDIYHLRDEETEARLSGPVELCLREQRPVMIPGSRLLSHRDESRSVVQDTAAPIYDRDSKQIGAILVFRDLTELRRMEHEMERLERSDALTGLLNRRELERRLREVVDSARRQKSSHALCYLDVDQFKILNDTCGHVAGDRFIQQLAALLDELLPQGSLLARLGGDEFGILLIDHPPHAARRFVERLWRRIAAFHFEWEGRRFPADVSGGLVLIDRGSPGVRGLLSAADAACYVAKDAGGHRVHEHQPGDTAIAERHGQMQWIGRIHQSIEADEFLLYQQVIEPLRPGAGERRLAELLIRLRQPDGKIVEPRAFIPPAERYGLISAIDRWVVRHAFEHMARAGSGSGGGRFAINISGQSLGEEGFLEFVIEQFRRTGADPECVHFEITETSAIADLPHAMTFMSALREEGCRFVLDDFGKGLSSFSYLKNLPVDFLKIDGEFVRNLPNDHVQTAVVRSIHEVGKLMGLETIAESVEDLDTVEVLQQIGVDYVQGFYFARPRPLDPA